MIQMLGFVEHEWVFNKLNFIKTRIHNQMIENFGLCVCMFEQSFFTMQNFHYDEFVQILQLEKC
jgi:hypothetical protein